MAISGAIHLQLVRTESLFALFAPVFQNQLPPEEKYSQAVLKHNIKRVQTILASLELSWWQAKVEEVFEYTHPVQSIVVLLVYWCLVLFFPAEWILPSIPILLLLKLSSNYISHQSDLIRQMELKEKTNRDMGVWGKGAEGFVSPDGEREEGQPGSSNGASLLDEDEEDDVDPDDDDGEKDDRIAAIGFLGKIRQYQKQLAKIQSAIGSVCDKLEAVQHLFRWTEEKRSKLVVIGLVVAFIFLLSM